VISTKKAERVTGLAAGTLSTCISNALCLLNTYLWGHMLKAGCTLICGRDALACGGGASYCDASHDGANHFDRGGGRAHA
jgi:hypothetical protein